MRLRRCWDIRMEYLATWREMERFHGEGACRAIGVSNFTREQLEHLCSVATVAPAVNQIELHPYLQQRDLVQHCASAGIRVMGYSPLGSATGRAPAAHGTTLLKHPTVLAVAAEVGKTPAQVLLRYGLQLYPEHVCLIPKSSNPSRIAENAGISGWQLPEDAMARLGGLECGCRFFIRWWPRRPGARRPR